MEEYSKDPVLQKYKCPLFKAEESEQKRLSALNEKIEQEKKEKNLIKSALSGQVLNKKIVFEIPKIKQEPVSKTLFYENDDNDGLDINESYKFGVPNKHLKGSKNSHLIELQSRFSHDPRFKIDDRFIDDERGDIDYSHEPENEIKKEEEKQLEILEDVLGKPLKRKFKQPEEKQQSSIIIPRYDPTKPESQKFKIRKVHKLEPYQLPQDDEESASSKPEGSKERFYEISETFSKDFNDSQFDGQSFSLTKLFGRPTVEATEAKVNTGSFVSKSQSSKTDPDSKPDKKRRIVDGQGCSKQFKSVQSISRSKFEDSDSDDDGDSKDSDSDSDTLNSKKHALKNSNKFEEKPKNMKKDTEHEATSETKKKSRIRENSKVSNPLLRYERFFFTDDDTRLQNNNFYNTERIKAHVTSWKQKKVVMTTALTKKRRHYKHVLKLKTALEAGDPKDKGARKKYRIYKETTKKH